MSSKEAIRRQMTRNLYSGLQYRTFKNILLKRLIEGYGYENKIEIARRLVAEVIDSIEEYMPMQERVKPGQLVWLARVVNDHGNRGQSSKDFEKIPVILDLVSEEDIQALIDGKGIKEVRQQRTVRMIRQAAEQGGTLANTDCAAICSINPVTVSKYVTEHEEKTGKLLPTAGTVLDIGPKITHKVQAVRSWIYGYEPLEIALKMDHRVENIERYIKDFKRVRLVAKRYDKDRAAFILKMSPNLVQQYWNLVEEFYPDEIGQSEPERPEDGERGDGREPPQGSRAGEKGGEE